MADFGVIAAVSETLQTVLTNALSTLEPPPPPIAQVHDLQGNIPTNPAQLTIFLFEAGEDPSARNRARVRGAAPPESYTEKTAYGVITSLPVDGMEW
jgi:hypothetical protein